MLPNTVEVDGSFFSINSDFADMLQIMEIFEGSSTDENKFYLALKLFYGETIPDNVEEAMQKLLWFVRCGKPETKEDGETLLDFTIDADLILSAFIQIYNVDLTRKNLHWWKFIALLTSLPGGTALANVQEIRTTKLSDVKDAAAKANLQKLKARYSIAKKADMESREQVLKIFNKIRGELKNE